MPTTSSQGKILSYRADRFGARLMSLVNAKRVSDTYGIPFSVYWVQTTDIGASFNNPKELFSDDFIEQHFISEDEWRKRRQTVQRIGDLAKGPSADFLKRVSQGKDILFDMAFGILCFTDEDAELVHTDFRRAFVSIAKSPELAAIFNNLGPKLQDFTAYHIRRGDLVDVLKAKNRSWPKKFIPSEFYAFHMKKMLKTGANVVLFSDEQDIIQLYKKQFPEALSLGDLIGGVSLPEGAYDFLELFAMSHCSKIIAPKQSAFSSTAAALGNITLVPLIEDFDTESYAFIFEQLIDRLESSYEVDFHQGETGQCLVHAVEYLIGTGQSERAGNLMETWVLRGLNIAHIYSSVATLQSKLGKFDAVLRIAEAADKGYVLFSKDKVILEHSRANAHLQLGDRTAARRHAQNALWSEPMHIYNLSNVASFYLAGIFDDSNAFPVDMELLKLDRRGGPARVLSSTYPGLREMIPSDEPNNLPYLSPLVWDWAFFLRNQRAARKADATRTISKIEKLRNRSGDAAWMRSFEGVLELNFGEAETATGMLQNVFEQSGVALDAFRCSYAYWQLRQFEDVIYWAEHAVKLSNAPIYKVWLANVLTRRKRLDEAEALLAVGVPPLDGFASVLEIEANLWQRVGNVKKVIETYEKITTLAPLSGYMRQRQAQALIDDGQEEAALKVMKVVCDTETATPKGYALYASLLSTVGENVSV